MAGRLQYALDLLRQVGVIPGTPPRDNENWYDGLQRDTVYGDTLLPTHERLPAFAFILERLLRLTRTYSGCFFLGVHHSEEEDECLIVPDNNRVPYAFTPKEAQPPPPTIVYFHHPTKGSIKVDSFYGALEIYGLLESWHDPNAHKWFDVARRMPDAPIYKDTQ